MNADNLFNRIARRYDIFNSVSSLCLDKYWRNKLALSLKNERNLKVLDVACGTGDVLLSLFKTNCGIVLAAGVDLSEQMLSIARKKLANYKTDLKLADASAMPYDDNYFDAITCSFGVRNFSDLTSGLKDMFRVLKLGGKLYILEFSIPQNKFIRFLYLPYLKFYIPLLGKFITGSFSAYKYLTRTVQFFPCGVEFCRILENAGFTDVKAQPLTFGIVTLYSARR